MNYRIIASTAEDNFVAVIYCNEGFIVTKVPKHLKYMLMWNITDVQAECERKGWGLEDLKR